MVKDRIIYTPELPGAESIEISKGPDSFTAEVNGKNIMALSFEDIKKAIRHKLMFSSLSSWTLMMVIDKDLNKYDIKFFGIMKVTGKPDRYLISDVITEGSLDSSAWYPCSDPVEWTDNSDVKLIGYSPDRVKALGDLKVHLVKFAEDIRSVVFSEDAEDFLDAYSKNSDVIFDVIKKD